MTEDLTPQDAEPVQEDALETPVRRRRFWPWLLALLAIVAIAAALNAQRIKEMLEEQLAPSSPLTVTDPASLRIQLLEQRVTALETERNASPLLPSEQENIGVPDPSREEQLSFGGRVSALEAEAQRLITANGALATRLDRMSELVAQLSGSTYSSHEQMRELMLITYVRRLVEQGRPLGALADIADEQFRPRDPSAADALAAWSQTPVSMTTLAQKLDELSEDNLHSDQKWWARLRTGLSRMVKVRGKDGRDPNALPKAVDAIRSQEIGTAITQMELLPSSTQRDNWLTEARTLQAALAALDRLETRILANPLADHDNALPHEAPSAPPVNARSLPPTIL